jgi:hypothetical protein
MALRYWLKTNKLRRFTYLDCSKLLILREKEVDRIDHESELAMESERKEVGVEISGQRGPDGTRPFSELCNDEPANTVFGNAPLCRPLR